MKELLMPIQPLALDEHGVLRFVENRIVSMLLDTHSTVDLNKIACMEFTQQERTQFAQLIGYSLSGLGELSYVDDETWHAAESMGNGSNELEARNEALRDVIRSVREGLTIMAPAVFRIHPDDLKE